MTVQQLLVSFVFLLGAIAGLAQSSLSPAGLVDDAKRQGRSFLPADLLERVPETRDLSQQLGQSLSDYDILQIKPAKLQQLLRERPGALRLPLPSAGRPGLELELVRVDPFAYGFAVYESSSPGGPAEVDLGLHYRGVVKGEAGAVVALSLFRGELMGMISSPKLGNLVLGRLADQRNEGEHVLYRDDDLAQRPDTYCATPDTGEGYTAEELAPGVTMRGLDDCVRIYLEVDYDIFQNKGGTSGAVNYVTGIFNQAATLYANENIKVSISEILVWDSASPYSGSSSSTLLNQFQSYRTSFNGDLAQLLSYKASGGIAVVNGLCRTSAALRMSFASIGSSYQPVPTYTFTVMVMTHELGHLMGSQHTHACVWNGNNTAIDGCAGFTEGGCANPGVPSAGGTIMSYCHLTSAGINFSLGFGTQPGNLIRNRVSASTCLQACSTGGGGGGGNDGGGGGGGNSCTQNEFKLTLVLDNYGSETTWQVRSSSGTVLYQGGPYANGAAGTTVTQSFCLPDGCYSFTISDAYGDGICCGYGNGSYRLTDAGGKEIAKGSNFGATAKTDFCTSGSPPDNPACSGREYYLALTLDDYGRETTWNLKNASGATLFSGGPYQNKLAGQRVLDTFCLAEGCYTFEILDAFGDGICCKYGNGSVALTDEDGKVVASGSNFGSGKRVEFCTSGDGGGGGGNNCTTINFSNVTIVPYGVNQDVGTFELLTNNTVLKIQNNAWKAIALNYNISESTVLEFDFRSTRQGEIHGIGLDDDDAISAQLTFQLYGTQTWGNTTFRNYPGDGSWKSYTIPVGQYYTGDASRLFFVADHDASPNNGDAFFRNIRIHEGGGCSGQLIEPTTVLRTEEFSPAGLAVFPNPAADQATLRFAGKADEEADLLVFNLMGQLVSRRAIRMTEGTNILELPVHDLPAGAYLVRLNAASLQREGRLTVQR